MKWIKRLHVKLQVYYPNLSYIIYSTDKFYALYSISRNPFLVFFYKLLEIRVPIMVAAVVNICTISFSRIEDEKIKNNPRPTTVWHTDVKSNHYKRDVKEDY